jgi:diguanylate cyclase (GGDEF)-like protein/PAS domain S-box-containing protein
MRAPAPDDRSGPAEGRPDPAVHAAEALVTGLCDPAALLDRELRLISYNAAYAALSGVRRSQLIQKSREGVSPFDLVKADQDIDRTNALACIKEGKARHLAERTVKNIAGQEFIVWLSFLPVTDASGRILGVIEILRDVTGDAQAHAKLKELLALTKARADDLERAVQQRTEELTLALENVTRLSRTDPLTGLLNRRAFTEQALQAIDLAKRHQRHLAVMMCDLDYFKKLNDEHGHQAGDAVLQGTARVLQSNVRGSDRAARFGGEEFVVLLSETLPSHVEEIAHRFNHLVRTMPVWELVRNADRPQTISIGVAVFPDHGVSLDELLKNADRALYVAKASGRDRSVLYDPSMAEDPSTGTSVVKSRVLIVDADEERANTLAKTLTPRYDVVTAPSASTGLLLASGGHYDAFVADEVLPDKGGVDFLGETLNFRPGALRMLCVAQQDFYLAVRATNLARVDHFLLREEAAQKLSDAVEDGLARKDMLREQLFADRIFSRSSYVAGAQWVEQVIREKNVNFAFQPIFHSDGRGIFGQEALCRVSGGVRLGPGELFEAAVRSGQIWRLGRLGREVIVQLIPNVDTSATLFLNLHPAEIEDPELTKHGYPLRAHAERVVFEITERASITDFDHFRAQMQRLRSVGYRFAVDDLGAGYASLSSVALLEPDFVKLDMSIIRNLQKDRRRYGLVQRIVDFANDHGIRVVAEGIETQDEARTAIAVGCHLLQGYHLGKPETLKHKEHG